MRFSVDPKDPGYAAFQALRARKGNLRVFFNGEAQTQVVTVDTDAGEILRNVVKDGVLQIDRAHPGRRVLQREIVRGEVRVEVIDTATEKKSAAEIKRSRKRLRNLKIAGAGGMHFA